MKKARGKGCSALAEVGARKRCEAFEDLLTREYSPLFDYEFMSDGAYEIVVETARRGFVTFLEDSKNIVLQLSDCPARELAACENEGLLDDLLMDLRETTECVGSLMPECAPELREGILDTLTRLELEVKVGRQLRVSSGLLRQIIQEKDPACRQELRREVVRRGVPFREGWKLRKFRQAWRESRRAVRRLRRMLGELTEGLEPA